MTTATAEQPFVCADTPLGRAFTQDGYVIVPGLYSGDEMLNWKRQIQAALAQLPVRPRSGVQVWKVDEFPAGLLGAMADEKVTPILQQLIGPDVEFLSAKTVFKDGATSFATPWHQDWHYWHGPAKLSVWIALDDALPENGCLRFVPGSHRMTFSNQRGTHDEGFDNRISDEQLAGLPMVDVAARRGDAVFFHDLMVHASYPNTVARDRWSFISTYRNAAIADSSKVWNQSLILCGQSVNPAALTRAAAGLKPGGCGGCGCKGH